MTNELKELLKSAKTEEEAAAILSAHKMALSDEDLQSVAGGVVLVSCEAISCNPPIAKQT